MLYTPHQPPSDAVRDRQRAVFNAMRRFDTNMRMATLGRGGHHVCDWFALPHTDPHGFVLSDLSIEALRERLSWALEPHFREAILAEYNSRYGRKESDK